MSKKNIDLDKYEEITDVTFDNENPHLALTHKSQGYSANGWHQSLLTKADESVLKEEVIKALEQITVKLSFEEFLRKFYGLWSDDAEELTKLLGMQTEYEAYLEEDKKEDVTEGNWHQEYLQKRIAKFDLIKSATSVADLSPEDYLDALSLQSLFEKGAEQFGIDLEDKTPESEGVVTPEAIKPSEKTKVTKGNKTPMKIEDVIKSAEAQALIQEEITKAVAAISAEKDAELESVRTEMTKAAAELAEFREQKQARVKEGFTNLVKSFTYVEEDARELLIDTLLKANAKEEFDLGVIVANLEKAQADIEKAKATFLTQEDGVEVVEDAVEINKSAQVADQVAAKYAGKKFLD